MADVRSFVFGPGSLWTEIYQLSDGTVPTNPVPLKLDVSQEFQLDIAMTTKTLIGEGIFPVAIGKADGKVTGKIKGGRFMSQYLFLPFAQAVSGTSQLAADRLSMSDDELGTVGSSPYTYVGLITTATKNWGVRSAVTGAILSPVASDPVAGVSYTVAIASGTITYTFAAGDAGVQYFFSYEYTDDTGSTISVVNEIQGNVGLSYLRYQGVYAGRRVGVYLPNITGSKLSLPTKQGDFVINEVDVEAFASPSGLIAALYTAD